MILITPMARTMGRRDRCLTEMKESMIRSRIRSLQWLAGICRPHMSYKLNHPTTTYKVNSSRNTSVISEIDSVIDDFRKNLKCNIIRMKPVGKKVALEVFADSSFTVDNQPGTCTLMRNLETGEVNIIGWKSQKSDRRAWGILAAETQAALFTIVRAIGVKTVFNEMGAKPCSTTVMTDNLSLKRVL